MIYTKAELKKALFFEIATQAKSFESLSNTEVEIWKNHFHPRYDKNNELTLSETYEKHAKFAPEFGTIVSVTMGLINDDNTIDVVSTEAKTEKKALEEAAEVMNANVSLTAAGYNLSNYTIPYLIKRMIVNKVKLPFHLQLKGKKPWEINMIDVMKDYQGTQFESIRLEVVANTLGIDFKAYDETKPTESVENYLTTVINVARAMSL